MKKLKVIENFTLKDYGKIEKIERIDKEVIGKLFIGDVIICDDSMAKYLLGNNPLKRAVVELIEDIPETSVLPQSPIENLSQKKTNKKKTSKK